MSGEPVPTSIRILEKEYVVSCPDGEQDALRESASFLNDRMLQARESGNISGSERIAVMTALNIVHDYLKLVRENTSQSDSIEASVSRIQEKLGATLSAGEST